MTVPPVGIDSIAFYTSRYYVSMADLAARRGIDPHRLVDRLGQTEMAVPPPGEDIVTLGANAARQAISRVPAESITGLYLATESAIDQSKAAGIYIHRLLGLSPRCRVVEFKQACYGATGALVMAAAQVRQEPDARILVIAADVARYGLETPGETTQGAGAAAMLVTADPKVLALDPVGGYHTRDVMDFWRPTYRDEALVDGKASIRIYLQSLEASWTHYAERTGRTFADFHRFCYHLPFTRMGEMAHHHLARALGCHLTMTALAAQIADSLRYNRVVGNTYAASLYVALCSLLDHDRNLEGRRIGLFSYGSGCMAEFFSGVVQTGYDSALHTDWHRAMLADRTAITPRQYERWYNFQLPTDGSACEIPRHNTGHYRLTGIDSHQRRYE